MNKADAWLLEEFNKEGEVIWCSLMLVRPTDLQWFRDLPTKKHNIVLTPLYKDETKSQRYDGVKSFQDATKRLVEANNGL